MQFENDANVQQTKRLHRIRIQIKRFIHKAHIIIIPHKHPPIIPIIHTKQIMKSHNKKHLNQNQNESTLVRPIVTITISNIIKTIKHSNSNSNIINIISTQHRERQCQMMVIGYEFALIS